MSSGRTARCAAASSALPTLLPRVKKSASENTPAARRPCTPTPCTATTVCSVGSLALRSAPGADETSSGQSSLRAPRNERPRNVSSVTTTLASQCSSVQPSSRGVEKVLIATVTAPIFAAPNADEPFGTVGDDQRDALASPDPGREQRPRKAVG